MTIQQAIEKAIEGGWSIQQSYYTRHVSFTKLVSVNKLWVVVELDWITENELGQDVPATSSHQTSLVLLDPLFWQALGKSLWLSDEENSYDPNHQEWLVQWHNMIDHLAEGNTIEEFFSKL